MAKKIISGGQTGADIAGVMAAKELGLETGGFMPRGFRTEAGPKPEYADLYGMWETYSYGYQQRTELNAWHSEATIIFGETKSAGSRLTINILKHMDKPYLIVHKAPDTEAGKGVLRDFLNKYDIINIAGNRESVNPGIQEWAKQVLIEALKND